MNVSVTFALLLGLTAMGTGGGATNADDKTGCDEFFERCDVEFVREACPLMCTIGNETAASFTDELVKSTVIVTAPVVAMMIGSLIPLFAQPGPWVKIIFSGGAAGILVAAVGFELFPILTKGSADWWAGPLGVLLGAGIFIVLGLVLPDLEDEEEDDDGDTAQGADSPTGNKSNPVFGVSERTRLLTDSSSDAEQGRATPSMNTVENSQDPPTFVTIKSSKYASLTLPWVRLAAVGLDGAVDGMLLGIVSSVGDKEAMLIAVGMTLEMCFVGVTLSTTLQKYPQPTWLKVLIVLVTPLAMYLGLVVGAYALYQVDQTTNEFVAVIGFGVSALLYLAVIELIPEIFDIGEDAGIRGSKVSGVATAVVFVGFAIILILEGALSEQDASV